MNIPENGRVVLCDICPNQRLSLSTALTANFSQDKFSYSRMPCSRFSSNMMRLDACCIVAIRYAEFSQACVERALQNKVPAVVYYGMFRDDLKHRKVAIDIETMVFKHWDGSNEAPPKVRPRPTVSFEVDGLCLISSTAAGPVWPESLAAKFPEKSAEKAELDKMKQGFLSEFPNARTHGESAPPSTPTRGTVRVTGQPDFSQNHGPEPLDVSRVVDCLVVSPPAPDDRPEYLLRTERPATSTNIPGTKDLTARPFL